MGLDALREVAQQPPFASSLPPSVLLLENRSTLSIFDAFPKAKYHFLVLPRIPFPADAHDNRELSANDLDSFESLLKHPDRNLVLESLETMSQLVTEMIQDEMVKATGRQWGVNVGFHAVPSMRHLHLHILSDDLVSPYLKTKKHYNSFRPDLGFFVPLDSVRSWSNELSVELAEVRFHDTKAPLACFKCGDQFANMPKLKDHLAKAQETGKCTVP